MTVALQLKNKVAGLIHTYGDSITYYSLTGSTFNEEGDLTHSYATGSSAKSIPSDMITQFEKIDQAHMPVGDKTFLCSGDMPMQEGWKINHNSTNYEVQTVKEVRLQDTTIYTRATCNYIVT